MVGFPISLFILNNIVKTKSINYFYDFLPTVTLMVVAHNKEKTIKDKLDNVSKLQYPKEKLNIIVFSDYNTYSTNSIAEKYITENK